MKRIKRIGPKSLAKVFAVLYAIMGLIGGIPFTIMSLVVTATGKPAGLFGLAAIVILPAVYGILGFVFGYLTAMLYNLVAKKFGGVEFEIESEI